VTPRKGHLPLVEALAGIGDLAWRLRCIGSLERDPATADALRAAIARSGLAARVELCGEWRPERLTEAYEAADGFVLASAHEGYGMAFAEALAHGLPVVGVAAGAVTDTVPAGAGLLVPPGDAPALGAALRRVMSDAALYGELARGARRAGEALPDWPHTIAAWEAACDRLAA
jgi:glycosyltransferase involved in cell wall biosynthesis